MLFFIVVHCCDLNGPQIISPKQKIFARNHQKKFFRFISYLNAFPLIKQRNN